jgi:hypothetical protein
MASVARKDKMKLVLKNEYGFAPIISAAATVRDVSMSWDDKKLLTIRTTIIIISDLTADGEAPVSKQ